MELLSETNWENLFYSYCSYALSVSIMLLGPANVIVDIHYYRPTPCWLAGKSFLESVNKLENLFFSLIYEKVYSSYYEFVKIEYLLLVLVNWELFLLIELGLLLIPS